MIANSPRSWRDLTQHRKHIDGSLSLDAWLVKA